MIDFQVGNERYGSLFRYLGRREVLFYPNFLRGRNLDFSFTSDVVRTSFSFGSFEGGRGDAKYRFSDPENELAGGPTFLKEAI